MDYAVASGMAVHIAKKFRSGFPRNWQVMLIPEVPPSRPDAVRPGLSGDPRRNNEPSKRRRASGTKKFDPKSSPDAEKQRMDDIPRNVRQRQVEPSQGEQSEKVPEDSDKPGFLHTAISEAGQRSSRAKRPPLPRFASGRHSIDLMGPENEATLASLGSRVAPGSCLLSSSRNDAHSPQRKMLKTAKSNPKRKRAQVLKPRATGGAEESISERRHFYQGPSMDCQVTAHIKTSLEGFVEGQQTRPSSLGEVPQLRNTQDLFQVAESSRVAQGQKVHASPLGLGDPHLVMREVGKAATGSQTSCEGSQFSRHKPVEKVSVKDSMKVSHSKSLDVSVEQILSEALERTTRLPPKENQEHDLALLLSSSNDSKLDGGSDALHERKEPLAEEGNGQTNLPTQEVLAALDKASPNDLLKGGNNPNIKRQTTQVKPSALTKPATRNGTRFKPSEPTGARGRGRGLAPPHRARGERLPVEPGQGIATTQTPTSEVVSEPKTRGTFPTEEISTKVPGLEMIGCEHQEGSGQTDTGRRIEAKKSVRVVRRQDDATLQNKLGPNSEKLSNGYEETRAILEKGRKPRRPEKRACDQAPKAPETIPQAPNQAPVGNNRKPIEKSRPKRRTQSTKPQETGSETCTESVSSESDKEYLARKEKPAPIKRTRRPADRKKVAFRSVVQGIGANSDWKRVDPSMEWSADQLAAFKEARSKVLADAEGYWERVAALVTGKSAEDCAALWESDWETPTMKKVVRAKRIATPDATQWLMQKGRSKRARETLKYRKSIRVVAAAASRRQVDDAMTATPFRESPGSSEVREYNRIDETTDVELDDGELTTALKEARSELQTLYAARTPEILSQRRPDIDSYIGMFKKRVTQARKLGSETDRENQNEDASEVLEDVVTPAHLVSSRKFMGTSDDLADKDSPSAERGNLSSEDDQESASP